MSVVAFGLVYPSYLTKSEVDFVLPTQFNPFYLEVVKQVGGSLILMLVFLFFTAPLTSSLPLGVLNAVVFSLATSGLFIIGGVLSQGKRVALNLTFLAYLLLTLFLFPRANMLYLLLYPTSYSPLLFLAFLIAVELSLFKVSRELIDRAIQQSLYPHGLSFKLPFPSSPFGAILYTTFFSTNLRFGFSSSSARNYRAPTLFLALPPSVVGAVVDVIFKSPVLNYLTLIYFVTFYVTYVGQSIQNERVWVNMVGVDPLKYVRWKMLARLLLSYVVLSPIAAAEVYLGLPWNGLGLLSLPLGAVPLTWLLLSFSPPPQVRDVEQIPFKFSIRGVLVFLGTSLAVWIPSILSAVMGVGSLEVLVAYLTVYLVVMYSPASRLAWRGFAERLTLGNYV